MKRDRQAVIKQMISRDKIGTQEEIKQRLEAEGITVTQATLSRDLREIGLLMKKADYTIVCLSMCFQVWILRLRTMLNQFPVLSLCWSSTQSWVKLMFWPT